MTLTIVATIRFDDYKIVNDVVKSGGGASNVNPIEFLGLGGTILIFLAFFFNDSKWIRIGNIAGSILFVIYGLMIGALSVWLLNGACIILNVVKLIQSKQKDKEN